MNQLSKLRELAEAATRYEFEPEDYVPPVACRKDFKDACTPEVTISLLDRLEKAEKDLNTEFAEHRSLGRLAKQAAEAMRRRGPNMCTHDAAVIQLINNAIKRLHI